MLRERGVLIGCYDSLWMRYCMHDEWRTEYWVLYSVSVCQHSYFLALDIKCYCIVYVYICYVYIVRCSPGRESKVVVYMGSVPLKYTAYPPQGCVVDTMCVYCISVVLY